MKHCPKCGKEYPDSYLACAGEGVPLVDGSATPWNRSSGGSRVTSELDDQTVPSAVRTSRRSPYLALLGILAAITLMSVSYPFLRDMIYEATSKVRSRNSATTHTSSATNDVISALQGWTAATNARNLSSHMSYYSENLSIYYGRRNVSREFVRANRAPAFNKYSQLKVQLTNIQVSFDPSGNTAVVTFDKTWDFDGARHSTGSSQQSVWLSHIGGRWLITGEKDLKVYHANW